MRESAVCLVGLSPPVVTEFVDYFAEGLNDVVLAGTSNSDVVRSVRVCSLAISRRHPHLHLHERIWRGEDVDDRASSLDFLAYIGRILREERQVHKAARVHVCIGGGRKNMGVVAALAAQITGIGSIYHVINRNVALISQRLERDRDLLERIGDEASAEEARRIYESNAEELDALLFPPKEEYEVIHLPSIPLPGSYLEAVVKVLVSDFVEMADARLYQDDLKALELAGLIEIGRSGRIVPTELGKSLGELFK